MSLLDSREQRQITLINSNRKRHHAQLTETVQRMGHHAQLTETVHRGWDTTHNSPIQFTEDGTVHRTHRDSSLRMGQYIELTKTVHRGWGSTHRSLEHSPRNSPRQFTEDGTVHTPQHSAQRMGQYTPFIRTQSKNRTVHTNHETHSTEMGQ